MIPIRQGPPLPPCGHPDGSSREAMPAARSPNHSLFTGFTLDEKGSGFGRKEGKVTQSAHETTQSAADSRGK